MSIHEARAVERILRAIYRIRRIEHDSDKLLATLSSYSERLNQFVKQEDESFLRLSLKGYTKFFQSYSSLHIPLKSTDYPTGLTDWRPFTNILHDLSEAIQLSVSRGRIKSADILAHWLERQLVEAARALDEYLFSRLLSPYRTMFYYAIRSGHEIGSHRPHFLPMQVFDMYLFRFGKTQSITLEEVKKRCRMGDTVIEHIHLLLRDALNATDEKSIRNLLRQIRPEQLFAHYEGGRVFDEFEIERKLRFEDLDQKEKLDLKEKREIIGTLKSFKNDYIRKHRNSVHGACAYLIEQKLYQVKPLADIVGPLNLLFRELGPWSNTMEWFETGGLSEDEVGERLWFFWPESRTSMSKDPMRAPILLFCLRTLEVLSNSQAPPTVHASRSLNNFDERIISVAAELVEDQNWVGLIGGIESSTLDRFISLVKEGRDKYRSSLHVSIVETPLSQRLIDEFKATVIDAFNQSCNIIAVMKRLQGAVPTGSKCEKTQYHALMTRDPREAFIEQDRCSYRDWGRRQGADLGGAVDGFCFRTAVRSIIETGHTQPQQSSMHEFIRAIEDLSESHGARPDFAVIPPGHSFVHELWTDSRFVQREDDSAESRPVYGIFDDLIVFMCHSHALQGILLGYGANLHFEEVEPLNVSVRDLVDDDIVAIMEEDKEATRENLLEQVLVKIALSFNFRIANPEQFRLLSDQ
ncbi:MAG: hypothetical protein Kow0074_09800 [Candidatus Zixiibacteriota bacterium]